MTVLLSMLQARGMWTMCSLHVTIRVSCMFDPHGEDTAGLARNSCCKSVGKGSFRSFRSFRLFIANLLHPGESSRDLMSFHIDRTASNSPPCELHFSDLSEWSQVDGSYLWSLVPGGLLPLVSSEGFRSVISVRPKTIGSNSGSKWCKVKLRCGWIGQGETRRSKNSVRIHFESPENSIKHSSAVQCRAVG